MLVRKAYEAVPTGGAFIVYESIIDDGRSKNAFGLLLSLNMFIETPVSARPASSTSSAPSPCIK